MSFGQVLAGMVDYGLDPQARLQIRVMNPGFHRTEEPRHTSQPVWLFSKQGAGVLVCVTLKQDVSTWCGMVATYDNTS